MYKDLLKHSIRALKRQKSYVLINVGGLAIGIACSLIIGLFIYNQLSYDQYHEKKNRIYQLVLHGLISGNELYGAYTAAPIGPAMKREFPEVENFLRINSFSETVVKYEDQFFVENHFLEADSSFFDFFSIKLLRGNPQTALNLPYNVVITQTTAEKLFGDVDPLEKLIKVGTHEQMHRITGIMEDVPENTHFKANMVGSFLTNRRANDDNWLSNSFSTYLLLHPDASPEAVNNRIPDMILKYVGPEIYEMLGVPLEDFFKSGNRYNIYLQPLTQIQLNPKIEQQLTTPYDPRYLGIFGTVGLLILIIAAINFMNLSTAQATKRAKEVGVKKVVGSSKSLLVWQFLIETVLLSFLAMLLAIVFTELSLPLINNLLDVNLTINYFSPWYTIPILLAFVAFLGILAGIYPAFYLSSFDPIRVLKGKGRNGNELINLRRMLTSMQFAISIVLIVGTLIMHRQINFMLNKELGFDKEHVVVLRRAGGVLREQLNSFKNELLTIPGILSVSASTTVPGRNNNNNGYMIYGRPDESFILQTNWVDPDYFITYGMQISDGRFFEKDLVSDRQACIINERSIANFNLKEPLLTKFLEGNQDTEQFPVIGVVKDFHHESLRDEIQPYILKFKPDDMYPGYLSIRLSPGAAKPVIDKINEVWDSFTAREPMLYFFMNEDFERLYKEEKQNASLSVIFTILAVIIASLGLYGLTSFTISQKTKEIGIRKTFGASTLDIWMMVIKEILILIAISTAVAWPLIYWVADNWLQNYYYRININPIDFVNGLFLATIVALLTISYRAIRAAQLNPSISLRYE
jgi:putative ABC transport system permease protein